MLSRVGVSKLIAGPAVARTMARAIPAAAAAVSSVTSEPRRAHAGRGFLEKKIKEAVVEARKSLSNGNNPRIQLAQYMSVKATMEQRVAALEQYTSKSILEHSPEDAMSIYEVNTDYIPPALRKPLERELEATGGFLMVREAMVQTVQFLRDNGDDINLPFPPELHAGYAPGAKNLALLYGHRGTGKSVTLAYAVEWAKQAGWLVVATSVDAVMRERQGLIQPSHTRPHTFTQPLYAREHLETLALENEALLARITLQGDYSAWPWDLAPNPMYDPPLTEAEKRSALPFPDESKIPRPAGVPTTLLELCALGAWRTDLATEALYAAYWELQHTVEVPVLFAIDNINALDADSDFVHPTRVTKLPARRLAGVDALANVVDTPPRRGAVIVAAAQRGFPTLNLDEMAHRAGTKIQLKRYTPMELQVMIEHYVVSKATFAEPNLTLLRRAEMTTGSVPADVHDYFRHM